MIIILNDIRSVQNVGSIFRTADAIGIEKIYLCGITPTPVNVFGQPLQRFVKVSLGAEKTVKWEYVKSAGELIKKIKKEKFTILAVEQNKKSIPYFKLRIKDKNLKNIALILGNEVNGLPKQILGKCDKIIEIPMNGKKESLNVAVSFGIVAFHLVYSNL